MIYNWTAKRAGPGITIRGTREGLPVKLVNVASVELSLIDPDSPPGIVAVMKDAAKTKHRLAAM